MSRTEWDVIRRKPGFYIQGFRYGVLFLLSLLLLNGVMVLIIAFQYLRQPEPEYYATNGVTSIVKLDAMSKPNNSSVALLEPDPPTGDQEKKIPE